MRHSAGTSVHYNLLSEGMLGSGTPAPAVCNILQINRRVCACSFPPQKCPCPIGGHAVQTHAHGAVISATAAAVRRSLAAGARARSQRNAVRFERDAKHIVGKLMQSNVCVRSTRTIYGDGRASRVHACVVDSYDYRIIDIPCGTAECLVAVVLNEN